MKKLLSTLCAISLLTAPFVAAITFTGCTTTEKQIAYQTLGAVGLAADNAMKAYAQGVKQGLVKPEERAKVAKMRLEFNVAYSLACDAASFNLQTFAPDDLIRVKNSLLALIVEVTQ